MGAAAAAGTEADGIAISWMFNRVFIRHTFRVQLPMNIQYVSRTFNRVTRSAACNSVNREMSSTIRPIVGSVSAWATGSGGGEDDGGGSSDDLEADVVVVARDLNELG